jgi:type I restriction enzyme M protein
MGPMANGIGSMMLLVEMLEPYKGRVYDPCCGSGGMVVQSDKFAVEHQGRLGDIAVYGQVSNPTTCRLCKKNLLANPPFNMRNLGGGKLHEEVRWQFGIPPNKKYIRINKFKHVY